MENPHVPGVCSSFLRFKFLGYYRVRTPGVLGPWGPPPGWIWNNKTSTLRLFFDAASSITSGQIIATSHDRFPPNGGLVREIPLFQGNLGW